MKNSWQLKSLNELDIYYFKGISPKIKTTNGDTYLIPSGAVFPDGVKPSKTARFASAGLNVASKYLKDDDILFNCGGVGTLGRSSLFKSNLFNSSNAVPDSFVLVLRSSEAEVLNKYIFYYFQTPNIKNEIDKYTRGTTGITSIKTQDILSFVIPFPKIEDQKKIVNMLDSVNQLRKKRFQAINLVETYQKSVYLAMFGKEQFSKFSWKIYELHELISQSIDCPHSTPKYTDRLENSYPCLRSSDIQEGLIDLSSTKYVDQIEYKKRIKRYIPVGGEIIFCREGARLGNAAILPKNLETCLGQRMMFFLPNEKLVTKEYLWASINNEDFQAQMRMKIGGAAAPRINIKDILKFKITLPPLGLQNKFTEIIHTQERLKNRMLMQLSEADNQFQALMQKSFMVD